MKSFVVLALLVAAAVAAPAAQGPDTQAETLYKEFDNIGVGTYKTAIQTSNGISQKEEGILADVGTVDEGISVRGEYSYTGPDGVLYTVTYVGDKNGYRASGAHLPA